MLYATIYYTTACVHYPSIGRAIPLKGKAIRFRAFLYLSTQERKGKEKKEKERKGKERKGKERERNKRKRKERKVIGFFLAITVIKVTVRMRGSNAYNRLTKIR